VQVGLKGGGAQVALHRHVKVDHQRHLRGQGQGRAGAAGRQTDRQAGSTRCGLGSWQG
jgi:hypothetical protein